MIAHVTIKRERGRATSHGRLLLALAGLRLWWVLFGLGLAAEPMAWPARSEETKQSFHFGISSRLMPDVNDHDTRAAMKVWADSIVNGGVMKADPSVFIFTNLASVSNALSCHQVDGVSVSTAEYFVLRNEIATNHLVFSVIGGDPYEEYELLVRKESRFIKVTDLTNCSLNVLRQSRACLASMWLDTVLLTNGAAPAAQFCHPVIEETKLAETVLPVFFGKVDACLATRKGFATMCELNPQLARELRVLEISPRLIPSVFFFRSGYPEKAQQSILDELTNAHRKPTGQQILTIFQTDLLVERTMAELDPTIEFLTHYQQLVDNRHQLKTVQVPSSSLAVKNGNAAAASDNATPPAGDNPNPRIP